MEPKPVQRKVSRSCSFPSVGTLSHSLLFLRDKEIARCSVVNRHLRHAVLAAWNRHHTLRMPSGDLSRASRYFR